MTLTVGALVLMSAGASAAPITGWNTDNVDVGGMVDDDDTTPTPETNVSFVYDRDITGGTAGAVSNGQIFYEAPRGARPGIKVVDRTYELQGQTLAGAIMASGTAEPDGPRMTGKRFKTQVTGNGPIDLVFDVDSDAPDNTDGDPNTSETENGYQVFQRVSNLTGKGIRSFSISLGFGVGDSFTRSTAGDGLGFSDTFEFGPNNEADYTQFPFSLFGDASTTPHHDIDGFFAPERTGFNMNFSEDELSSDNIFGPYKERFGPWLAREDVPTGVFWDDDGDPDTHNTLMAWLNADGMWELRRDLDSDQVPFALDTAELFESVTELEERLGVPLLQGDIDNLANLNTNYAIRLPGETGFDSFTIRLDTEPVPTPTAFAMLVGAGAVGLGTARKRPRRAAIR